MDVVGSDIGHKMRSAIKAKLTELGCYVDDELPDYVMVMVANKRTRSQMEEDLHLFLGEKTPVFVAWLYNVLKKLQEFTVTAPTPIIPEPENVKGSVSKDRKGKEKKEKKAHSKRSSSKKAKKKSKEHSKRKMHKHKHKKKSKEKKMIRPNIPPLLMNMEKESEPSITDIFAGQILKNHGVTLSDDKNTHDYDIKPFQNELKRPFFPIIDLSTITSTITSTINSTVTSECPLNNGNNYEGPVSPSDVAEGKLQGMRQRIKQQLQIIDDEDTLTIQTEAKDCDFSDESFQQEATCSAVPTTTVAECSTQEATSPEVQAANPFKVPEVLPQIELNLPKWPAREKIRPVEKQTATVADKEEAEQVFDNGIQRIERFTPDKEQLKRPPARCQLDDDDNQRKARNQNTAAPESSNSRKRLKRSGGERSACEAERAAVMPASVVVMRPRPRNAASTSNLLMRAMADAQKSLQKVLPKPVLEPKVRVPPVSTQRTVFPQASNGHNVGAGSSNLVVQFDCAKIQSANEEYIPLPITMKFVNTNYTPTVKRPIEERLDPVELNPSDIHHRTADQGKTTLFVVTLDGLDPNIFLAKKMKSEGIIDSEDEIMNAKKQAPVKTVKKKKEVAEKDLPVEADKSNHCSKLNHSDQFNHSDESNHSDKSNHSAKSGKSDKSKHSEIAAKYDEPTHSKKSDKSEKPNHCERLDISDESNHSETSNHSEKSNRSDESGRSAKSSTSSTSDAASLYTSLSYTSESDTQVIIKPKKSNNKEEEKQPNAAVVAEVEKVENVVKKRKASPIIFDVGTKETELSKPEPAPAKAPVKQPAKPLISPNSSRFEVPNVEAVTAVRPDRKNLACSAFPQCRYGSNCAFTHPPCMFGASCTRRGCMYAHPPASVVVPASQSTYIASHVVPAANYKSISTKAGLPNVCKYYPNCSNPSCHFSHPKPCRYGRICANKHDCNFYHFESPASKWRSAM